jgi:hypothetical protein
MFDPSLSLTAISLWCGTRSFAKTHKKGNAGRWIVEQHICRFAQVMMSVYGRIARASGKETPFLRHLYMYLNPIFFSPRQARDKHRKR